MKRKTNMYRIRKQIITTLPVLATLAILVSFTASCGVSDKKGEDEDISREDVKREIAEAADTTAEYLEEEKMALIEEYRSRMQLLRDQIKEYNAMVSSAGEDVTQLYSQKIESLEDAVMKTENSIDSLMTSSQNAWMELNEGVESALDELEKAIEDARNEFIENPHD